MIWTSLMTQIFVVQSATTIILTDIMDLTDHVDVMESHHYLEETRQPNLPEWIICTRIIRGTSELSWANTMTDRSDLKIRCNFASKSSKEDKSIPHGFSDWLPLQNPSAMPKMQWGEQSAAKACLWTVYLNFTVIEKYSFLLVTLYLIKQCAYVGCLSHYFLLLYIMNKFVPALSPPVK